MNKNNECEDGACAVDYTKETVASNKTLAINKAYIIPIISLLFLLLGIGFYFFEVPFFKAPIPLIWFSVIYMLIGGPVLLKAAKLIVKGTIYNEFVLMSVATIGAFLIGSYEEGVAVMLFYVVGELFQDGAVNRAKRSIEALLKVQVEEVTIIENELTFIKHPKDVNIGQIIRVKAGEKIALDGELISNDAVLNTAALTGESVPKNSSKGEQVLAGMVNLTKVIEIKVTSKYEDTKLSKILKLVQEAVGKKAKTQLLISRLAKIYTPIVFWLAIALVIVPYFILADNYIFQVWLQRALIFLVISCPCALVISIPLGYFGGIGAASHNGILFKGSNYLDLITKVDTVVMDKTGTLTKGVFEVQEVVTSNIDKNLFLELVAVLESNSSHPIAQAIVNYVKIDNSKLKATTIEEISGYGMKGKIGDFEILAGNSKLLKKFNIPFDEAINSNDKTIVVVAINQQYVGYITISDTLKEDALKAITNLHKIPIIIEIVMLSGDKQAVVDTIANKLGIDKAIGDLLPEDKISEVEKLKAMGRTIAFIGDGINDAPVITIADVGMAMGGLGSDAAIETADVVIQTDQPSKIVTAIKIGNATNKIIWQNIWLALSVKILVLILGAWGMATMWEAVIADVGVALLAILNAVRIQKMKWK
ncbi:heavy metal translocating P-type ATPase [Lutibacter sp. B1]|uniref:heavy metal translocating P-type ATPase n=1 Tax=Lutibacter sp. B1 TaxID=2725996 RepID=UPI001456EA33|nr:heavy metal translocating P-type ATPase [Lutibacter sp. B1]NLP58994.1 heavy metal translocating P-type ATPase [Lutibacter sp. B1]